MHCNYTIIISQNQHFGDEPEKVYGVFRGTDHEYIFDCPNINPGEAAVWYAESDCVDFRNRFRINGHRVEALERFKGTSGRRLDTALIPPRLLRESGNVLRIEATYREEPDGSWEYDDFVVDNFVLFYKTINQFFDLRVIKFGFVRITLDGENANGQNVATGQYFYIVHLNDKVVEKRMLLIKQSFQER